MKLIVVRHGQTEWNLQSRVLGRTDIPLNEKGKEQAVELAENLLPLRIDHIYVSPLKRSAETGRIIADACGADLTVREELLEHDFGAFEGVSRSDENYQSAKRNFAVRYPGGESYFDVAARVYPFLKELKEREDSRDFSRVSLHSGFLSLKSHNIRPQHLPAWDRCGIFRGQLFFFILHRRFFRKRRQCFADAFSGSIPLMESPCKLTVTEFLVSRDFLCRPEFRQPAGIETAVIILLRRTSAFDSGSFVSEEKERRFYRDSFSGPFEVQAAFRAFPAGDVDPPAFSFMGNRCIKFHIH